MTMCKYNIKLDHEHKRIILSKGFNKKQSDIMSMEYAKLCEVVQMFPGYEVSVKTIKKNPHKEAYKGLTYEYMERYISVKGAITDRQEYDNMRLLAECHSKRFPVLKQWFLRKFPEVEKYGAKEEFLDVSGQLKFGINEDFTALAEAI